MTGRWIVILLITALLSACGKKDKIPAGILKPDKMQAVLWDVIRADAYTTNFISKDSAKNEKEENALLQQKIFAIHKISKEDFDKSFSYYRSHTTIMKDMVDTMLVRAERDKDIKQKLPTLRVE